MDEGRKVKGWNKVRMRSLIGFANPIPTWKMPWHVMLSNMETISESEHSTSATACLPRLQGRALCRQRVNI